MRIAIGGFKQESNTFATAPTTLKHFEDFQLWRGEEIFTNLQDTNTEIGGFIDVCREMNYVMLPTLATFAISGAPLTADTYQALRDELLDRLASTLPVDGVLLSLHGAMVVEGEDDPDGAVLQAVRALIGPAVPLAVTLDLHAKVTRRYIDYPDILVGFRTSPHIDQRLTGQRAAHILTRCLKGEVRPAMAYAKIPMVTPASTHTHHMAGPYQRLMEATTAAETNGVLATTLFTVQPWLNIPDLGFAAVVITNNDPSLAGEVACHLANQAWNERHALGRIELVPPEQAIRQALARQAGPVVLSDLADNPGAGSPGDGTAVIAALLAVNPAKMALVCVYDPEVASAAAEIGINGNIDMMVGGKLDRVYNRPVRFTGQVTFAQPAGFRFSGQGYTGMPMDMGLSAVLRQGHIHLLVTSKPAMSVDPAFYRAAGLDPAEAQIVVVKSHMQFRAGYADIAQEIILLDSPGMSSDHLTTLSFDRVDRPLFPFDTDFDYICRPYSPDARG